MSSEDESEVEWEDVERLDIGTTEDPPTSSQAPLQVQVSLQPQDKKGTKKSFLEKAIAAYNTALQQNLHKAHLLCLLANALQLSGHCDQCLPQSLVLSVLPSNLLPSPPAKDSLHRLLTWYKGTGADALVRVLTDHCCVEGLSIVQVFVTLLRAAGLKARLVLALCPVHFRCTQLTPLVLIADEAGTGNEGTPRKEAVEPEQQPSQMTSCDEPTTSRGARGEQMGPKRMSSGRKCGRRGLKRSQLSPAEKGEAAVKAEGCGNAGTEEAGLTPRNSKRKRKNDTPSIEATPSTEAGVCAKEQTAGVEDLGKVLASQSEEHLATERKRSLRSHKSIRTADYVEEEYVEEQEEGVSNSDGDCDSVEGQHRKRKRKKKQSPSSSSSSKGKNRSSRRDSPKSTGGVSSNPCSPTDERKHVSGPYIYDENSSWAEVFLEDQQRWVSLHLTSCTVDCPQLCERHAPYQFSYIVAIENGMLLIGAHQHDG